MNYDSPGSPVRKGGEDVTNERWNTAVDWLLNSRYAIDANPLFYAYVDGLISGSELRAESVTVNEINSRRAVADRIREALQGSESRPISDLVQALNLDARTIRTHLAMLKRAGDVEQVPRTVRFTLAGAAS